MPTSAAEYDQTQSTSVNQHPLDAPMVKPLICSFFKRASAMPPPPNVIHGRGSTTSRVTQTHATPSPQHTFPPPMDEAMLLFPLTPSVKVPLRHSKRSGRVLNESETLQEKHAQEYRFVVPMLAYAIECTIAEHDAIRQGAGLPAYISPSSSPVSSPARKRQTSGDFDSDAATGEDRPRVSSMDSTGERNAALGFKAFQAAINAFSTREVPAISVHDYLKRMVKYTYVSPSVLVCCCLYLDRLLAMYPSFLLHPNNVFKFLITSTRICSKIMDTRTLNNRDFSVVGGVTNEDINALEFTFVQLLQNRLYISRHTFDIYCDPLRRQAAHVDVEGEWDGTTLAMVLPVNGGRPSGYPHQPSRPSLGRNSACGGSVLSRSRRSSIMSQNEYSISMASQSGVSPLRSASRPAFPPSASMGQSISVDGEFLASARQPSAAGGSSGRRHPMSSSFTNNASVSGMSRSPVLPQVHPPATTANGATTSVVPVIRNVNSAATLRSSGNGDDAAASSSNGFAHSATGAFMSQLRQHTHQGFEGSDDSDDARARSIPVAGSRGFSASWDTARTTRPLASTTGGVGPLGVGTSTIAAARSGSPNVLPTGAGAPLAKARSMDGVALSSEGNMTPSHTISGERTPTRRAFAGSARSEGVALPPVPQSGRRGRSGSFVGNAEGTIPNVPPPPEFRQRS